MGDDLFSKGAAIGAKASELIRHTPPGYVEIGSSYAEIAPLFDRYSKVPTRAGFQGLTDQIRSAMVKVAYSGQGAIDHSGPFVPNNTFGNMERIATDIDDWKGEAASSFIDNYQAATPFVPQAQFIATSVLIAAMEAEIQLWESVTKDINDIADKTLSALDACDDKDGAEFSFWLTVFAAVATVGVTVVTAGGGTAIALTVAAGVASSGASARSIDHSTDSPENVLNAMYSAIDDLNGQIVARETQIQKGLTDMTSALNTDFEQKSWPEGVFPTFRFKPPALAKGPGDLGSYQG